MGISKLKNVLGDIGLLRVCNRSSNFDVILIDFSTIFYRYLYSFDNEESIIDNIIVFLNQFRQKKVYVFYDEGCIDLKKELRIKRSKAGNVKKASIESDIKIYENVHGELQHVKDVWDDFLVNKKLSGHDKSVLKTNVGSCVGQIKNDPSFDPSDYMYVPYEDKIVKTLYDVDDNSEHDEKETNQTQRKKVSSASREHVNKILKKINVDKQDTFYGGIEVFSDPLNTVLFFTEFTDNLERYVPAVNHYFSNALDKVFLEKKILCFKQKVRDPKFVKYLELTMKDIITNKYPDYYCFESDGIDAEFFLGSFLKKNLSILSGSKLIISSDQDVLLFCSDIIEAKKINVSMGKDDFKFRPSYLTGFISRIVLLFNGGDYNSGIRGKKITTGESIPSSLLTIDYYTEVKIEHVTYFISDNMLKTYTCGTEPDMSELADLEYSIDFINKYSRCDISSYDYGNIINIELVWKNILVNILGSQTPECTVPEYRKEQKVNVIKFAKIICKLLGVSIVLDRGFYMHIDDPTKALVLLDKLLKTVNVLMTWTKPKKHVITDKDSLYITPDFRLLKRFGNIWIEFCSGAIELFTVSGSDIKSVYEICCTRSANTVEPI
ncbi:G5 protein [Salmon gill poxvirus]